MSFGFGIRQRAGAERPETRRASARLRTLSRALVLLLLFCLLAQGTAVRTHLHFIKSAATLQTAADHPPTRLSQSSGGEPAVDCPLCREAAMAGSYVLPPVAVLPPRPLPASWGAAAASLAFALPAPAPGWRSRAPPK